MSRNHTSDCTLLPCIRDRRYSRRRLLASVSTMLILASLDRLSLRIRTLTIHNRQIAPFWHSSSFPRVRTLGYTTIQRKESIPECPVHGGGNLIVVKPSSSIRVLVVWATVQPQLRLDDDFHSQLQGTHSSHAWDHVPFAFLLPFQVSKRHRELRGHNFHFRFFMKFFRGFSAHRLSQINNGQIHQNTEFRFYFSSNLHTFPLSQLRSGTRTVS